MTPRLFVKLADKAAHLAESLARWSKAGFPVVDEATFKQRIETCRACEHWHEEALIPTCDLCGCTAIKQEFATEKCPLGKWPEFKPNR